MQFSLNIDGFGQNGGSISKLTQAQLQWKSESSYSSARRKPCQRNANSRYRKYAIWPRDGACHANHACAALAISRSCRQAFVFFHWKCTQVSQKSLSLIMKHTCFKRYHHNLLRHFVCIFNIWVVYVIQSKN